MENRNKARIYKFYNKKTNKCYVGRSNNLKRRLLDYYNDNYLNNNKHKSFIYKDLLEHGKENFSREI